MLTQFNFTTRHCKEDSRRKRVEEVFELVCKLTTSGTKAWLFLEFVFCVTLRAKRPEVQGELLTAASLGLMDWKDAAGHSCKGATGGQLQEW